MEYDVISVIKESEKGSVHLVREKNGEQVFIRKILKGRHQIYEVLQNCPHPYLPKLYEIILTEDATTIIEEYIEGKTPYSEEMTEKQFLNTARELCSVLEFLHGKGIIHRDIKPSNIILAKDGHIRLIDFDAARMPKDNVEQDTKLLGTRGYAPPEQYGFAQTDERADIYSLGITLEQFLAGVAQKSRYKKIIRKCTDLNPDKRYQSVRQVRNALFHAKMGGVYICAAVLAIIVVLGGAIISQRMYRDNLQSDGELAVLPVPGDAHWDGETGSGLWLNILESGTGNETRYNWRLYRRDTADAPEVDEADWICDGNMSGNNIDDEYFSMDFGQYFAENGFYYFAVSSVGDNIQYTDSPWVISDAFEYTGEDAPMLPVPTDLAWRILEEEDGRYFYATWGNLDDYADSDSFNVCVYDENGDYVMNNIWPKWYVLERGMSGIHVRQEFLTERNGKYHFTVQALSSRPNEFRSSPMPEPPTEEYFSPWYTNG